MSRLPRLAQLSVVLFVAGEVAILATVGMAAWPVVVAWGMGALLVALVAWLVRLPAARVVLAGAAVVACGFLTFEGGLFFMASAIALFAVAVQSLVARRRPAPVPRRG